MISVVQKMPEKYRLFDNEGRFQEPQDDLCLKKAVRFLDGGWLEWYIYKLLKENYKDEKFDIDIDWQIQKLNWKTNFQIDNIMINGYQLIGISCTTSIIKAECKNKGFEIILRTRQIGGEEARAILITISSKNQTDVLQEELELDTGGSENILVLGIDDLKPQFFHEKIGDFIK